ncbi:hypothetical protein [Nitratireductor soli]|uniref:hypothetical protein n=1 Tax=Nitratireductor soli TaxID=1670619 RepID=UPI00065DE93C|nr:hypothetical protein [Nitratireductor soli]
MGVIGEIPEKRAVEIMQHLINSRFSVDVTADDLRKFIREDWYILAHCAHAIHGAHVAANLQKSKAKTDG